MSKQKLEREVKRKEEETRGGSGSMEERRRGFEEITRGENKTEKRE